MIRLAVRNLFQGKVRLLMSTAGLALALLLVLTLDAIWTGSESQVSAYIDRSGADVWVAQQGVRNMHMASSTLPVSAIGRVRQVPGVASVTPILYQLAAVNTGRSNQVAYLIGLPANAAAGAPWKVMSGRGMPGPGETVIDRSVASDAGIGIGDTVTILNRPFTVVGLTGGTLTIVNSVAFISMQDFMDLRRSEDAVSYLLVKAIAGQTANELAHRIEQSVGGVTALTREEFSNQERQVVAGMSTDIVAIMNLVGLLIGLAVMALSIYTATLSRRVEYGVLKAVGAGNRHLYAVVLVQAGVGLVLGLLASIALTFVLSVAVPIAKPSMALEMSLGSLMKVTLMAVIIGTAAAALPIWQMSRLDPAQVFRRKVA